MNRHVDDQIELYVLGKLAGEELRRFEAHLHLCRACTAQVGLTESTVLALETTNSQRHTPTQALGQRIAASARSASRNAIGRHSLNRWIATYAVAASILIAVLTPTQVRLSAIGARNDQALVVIVQSHFRHVNLRPVVPDAPAAKVLYAHDGSWLYLIIDRARCGCRVIADGVNGDRDVGVPLANGSTSTLFLAPASDIHSLSLEDITDKRMLGTATLLASP